MAKLHWCDICKKNVRHTDIVHGIRAEKERKARQSKQVAKEINKK